MLAACKPWSRQEPLKACKALAKKIFDFHSIRTPRFAISFCGKTGPRRRSGVPFDRETRNEMARGTTAARWCVGCAELLERSRWIVEMALARTQPESPLRRHRDSTPADDGLARRPPGWKITPRPDARRLARARVPALVAIDLCRDSSSTAAGAHPPTLALPRDPRGCGLTRARAGSALFLLVGCSGASTALLCERFRLTERGHRGPGGARLGNAPTPAYAPLSRRPDHPRPAARLPR